uniref:Photosystem I subunit O n=1 Tax=Aegilops tauschii subsp. strangulata TaxID=200361 RepID=A0A453BY92_AEGTS
MAAATSTVSGLAGAALARRPAFSTSFTSGGRVSARNPLMTRNLERNGRITCMTFPRDWLRRDLNVIGFGLIGWLAPSSIPLINGNSLTGLFFSSIGEELAHFPSPPALQSQLLQAVVGDVAPGSVHRAHLRPDRVQGQDRGLLPEVVN